MNGKEGRQQEVRQMWEEGCDRTTCPIEAETQEKYGQTNPVHHHQG